MAIKPARKKLLLSRVSRVLGEQTIRVIRADKTVSRSLKPELYTRAQPGGNGTRLVRKVAAKHFWAKWYHDGRGAVVAKAGRWLAFWRNVPKAFDPRLRGGRFPVRKSEVRRLRDTMDDEQFRQEIEAGRLTLTKRVGPWRGNRFFPRAFRKQKRDPFLRQEADDLAEREVTKILDSIMKTSEKRPVKKDTIYLRLKRP